ncbi:hypothetical protein [Nocardioides halotolerans]|jgi:hypothetical protein|uniref:hypothetical protein n=1 Tax=Nocardioides halotolerans TaxID=433660 RepID=UPI0004191DBE|nr:hypothetical protein [Nocardioides halotolerans]
MSGHEQDTDIRDSTPNSTGPSRAAGGMGVSSERVGHTGPGQHATDGIKDTSRTDAPNDEEQRLGADESEAGVEGLDPAAGYPSLDPRSEDKPYKDA